MASSSSGSRSWGSIYGGGDPFDIPAKGAPIERLKKWRAAYHFKEAGGMSFQSRETVVPRADGALGFGIQEDQLRALTWEHNYSALQQYGGISGIANLLNTDTEKGISGDNSDLLARRNAFGSNTYPRKRMSFSAFICDASKDSLLIILMVAAIVLLALGITSEGIKQGWYDGASIAFAVLVVVFTTAISDYMQALQFQILYEEKQNMQLEVVRVGRRIKVLIHDLVVGDVVPLKIGDQVPADGILISGQSLFIDESSMTGEIKTVYKDQNSMFLKSGCKVARGYGTMLVTAVGINTEWGLLMASISEAGDQETPLQVRLNGVATFSGMVVIFVAVVVLVVLQARYFTGRTYNPDGSVQYVKGKTGVSQTIRGLLRILTLVVTLIVVAVPEGLPLAVTLTLAFSLRKMMRDKALIRRLSACETMGSVTTICSDKTGNLTLNQMTVVEAYFGGKKMDSPDNAQILSANVTSLIIEGIAQNTSGSIFESESGQAPEVTGSPTEKAILSWGLKLGMKFNETRSKSSILHVLPFNSEKKRGGIAVHLGGPEVHIHWKGAAEIVLDSCTSWLDPDGSKHSMTPEKVIEFKKFIEDMAAASLRCIAFAYSTHDMNDVPNENKRAEWKFAEDNLIMLGIVGIKNPCHPGVRDSVQLCTTAGIKVRMVTGDNLETARAIALECGILTDPNVCEPIIIKGETFRALSNVEMEEVADKILVMGRSSPNDKLLLVKALQKRGDVVAVTGDGINDAPVLHEADIGLSMGIQGTEVVKESSDITILDDNFTSVVRVVRWGRAVYANIQRFTQFQLTANIAALIINVVVAVSSGDMPLNAVQLLWVNTVIDTLGALALATELPTDCLMQRPPIGKREPLITNIMWRNLIIMVCFQVSVLLTLNFRGKSLSQLKNDNPAHADKVKNTFIFSTFVLFQVFNEFNSRKLDELNIFKGITKNCLFVGIIGITIILQALIIEFFGKFTSTVKLSWQLWMISIGLAFFSWPLAFLGKLIPVPDRPSGEFIPRCGACCVLACTCLPSVIGLFLSWLASA